MTNILSMASLWHLKTSYAANTMHVKDGTDALQLAELPPLRWSSFVLSITSFNHNVMQCWIAANMRHEGSDCLVCVSLNSFLQHVHHCLHAAHLISAVCQDAPLSISGHCL